MEKKYRIEKDTMGEMKIEEDKLWGAQTQRSFENFKIGIEKMPEEIIKAFGILKKACALANNELGILDNKKTKLISDVCDEIIKGIHKEQFPLVVWQTGSGTQSNMNINEVIANRAYQIDNSVKIHPNDDVNKGQSSNDTFPSAIHISAILEIENKLLPSLEKMENILEKLSNEYMEIIKIGRTHLQDATPLTLGQEISGWYSMIKHNKNMILDSLKYLRELALGGTAVGTGINTKENFGEIVANKISEITKTKFITAENKFHSLTSKDAISYSHGSLKTLAVNLFKIANDVRMLASGPRSGIGEIFIPENEPGSSIMPGKVNPTQSEALTMVCAQVMGNDVTISIGASQGHYQLNVFMPVIIYNYLQSVKLLSEGIESFCDKCLVGLKPNFEKIKNNLENSLMLVTVLNPHIGYEKSAEIAKLAYKENITLKEACIKLGYLSEKEYDKFMDYKKMIPGVFE